MLVGTILLHKNFVFDDGTTKDKYLIIIASVNNNLIAVKTTSQGHRYRNDFGCQSGSRFPAFLLVQGCCCFPKNTWICLGDFYEMDSIALQTQIGNGQVYRFGNLENEFTRDIQFCAKECDDISELQEDLINQSLAPATKLPPN